MERNLTMDCFNYNCPFWSNTTSSSNRCECIACPNRCEAYTAYASEWFRTILRTVEEKYLVCGGEKMNWTNKAILAWGWLLTPEEIATLPNEVYAEWVDNELLLYPERTDKRLFAYFYVEAGEFPRNITDISPEIDTEEIAKKVEAFHKAFPARTDESQAYLWSILY